MKSKVLITYSNTLALILGCSQLDAQQQRIDTSIVYVFVKNQATFQGGDIYDFLSWVQENLVYPQEDLENNIFGKVTVQFVISRTGHVMDAKLPQGVTQTIDAEAIRVILSSPEWEPAKMDGVNLKQQFTIPVIFSSN